MLNMNARELIVYCDGGQMWLCCTRPIKRLIPLATTVSMILATPIALAQDQTTQRRVAPAPIDSSEQHFIIEHDLAISKMSLSMLVGPTGDVDHDFVAAMMPHHQGAIDIARAELKYGHNDELRRLAQNIIAQREREISAMRGAVGEARPLQTSDTAAPESKQRP
ncbi:DUF305 domain-containing protein [Bradyrhizobium lablabi]|nr:DUF305 domain-containing protein [Bradyrhizobium lablabi]